MGPQEGKLKGTTQRDTTSCPGLINLLSAIRAVQEPRILSRQPFKSGPPGVCRDGKSEIHETIEAHVNYEAMIITLRTAGMADEAFLYELYVSTRAEEMAAWGWNEAQQRAFLNLQFRGAQTHYAEYPNPDHKLILADERPIGRIFLSRLQDEIRLVDITLLPEARGRGIGTALIRELFEESRSAGKAVRLHVEKLNRARQLYVRLGFRVIGDAQSHYFMEWTPFTGETQC